MNTSTWYFWKWSANRMDGQPEEVCEALAGGKSHPATLPFDPEPLLEKFEIAKKTMGIGRSRWRWTIAKDPASGLARLVKLVLPSQAWDYPAYQAWIDLFLPLNLFGWHQPLAESFPGTLPKHNVWSFNGSNDSRTRYEVKPGAVSRLLKEVGYAGTVLLMNHRNDYVNVAKAYGRFTVEWRYYPNVRQDPERFSHWRAAYLGDPAQTAAGKPVERKFLPALMADVRQGWDGNDVTRYTDHLEYELLTPGDTAFVLRAFIRGEKRPQNFRWISITRRLQRQAVLIREMGAKFEDLH
jgi:hypothetical protein